MSNDNGTCPDCGMFRCICLSPPRLVVRRFIAGGTLRPGGVYPLITDELPRKPRAPGHTIDCECTRCGGEIG